MKLSSIRQAAKSVPLRRVWQTAEKAHAICGKSTAALFTDMLRCAKRYGAGPTDYMMFEFYDLNDDERATYLTRVRSAAFVKRVNNRADAAIFNDKNAFFEKFRPLMGREALNLFKADAELESEGYVVSVTGKGSFVAEGDTQNTARKAELTGKLKPVLEELRNLGMTREELLQLWEGEKK